jgi:tetratricopeptide (TPR) repeat protein
MTTFNNPIVFINYRRADTSNEARGLNNDLEHAFGKGFVFQDRDDLISGEIWSEKLIDAGNNAKVIIAVIGPNWLQRTPEGDSRLNDPNDWVRKELVLAIQAKKIIIPVLVSGAKIPSKTDVPASLHQLYNHQFFELRGDKWNIDLPALIKDISSVTKVKTIAQLKEEKKDHDTSTKEKLSKKKILWLTTGMVLIVGLFIGFLIFNSDDSSNNGFSIDDISGDGIKYDINGNPIIDDDDEDEVETIFCPEFDKSANITTLLYPFGNLDGSGVKYELKVQNQLSDICNNFNIYNDVKNPNIKDDQYYTDNQAKTICNTCSTDIFITGMSTTTSNGVAKIKANIGFCDAKFNGYSLDKNKLQIVTSISEADILDFDANISESLEYAITLYLGIFQIKKGNLEGGVKIIQDAMKKYPDLMDLDKAALDILWQAQHKLGKEWASANSLDKLYLLDQQNIMPLKLKADLYFQNKNFDKAINEFNLIIDKENNKVAQNIFLERRGDSYFETKQYAKAKMDYMKVSTVNTTKLNKKIRATNKIIKNNDTQINKIGDVNLLSPAKKGRLINLHLQNGNVDKAAQVYNTLESKDLDSPNKLKKIGLNTTILTTIQKSDIAIKPELNVTTNKLHHTTISNNNLIEN